jgi:hypothetical protein
MSHPKLASLVNASGGNGSHFILYKLAGHPNVATLKELSFKSQGGTTKRDLKSWHSGDKSSLRILQTEQLEPQKALIGSDIEWIFVNKPTIKNCIYHRAYTENYPMFYILRNPVAFYYTWKRKWQEYTSDRGLPDMSDDQVFKWVSSTLMSSLYEYAQYYDREQDYIISFEHFISNTNTELKGVFSKLGLSVVNNEDLITISHCPKCGSSDLMTKKIDIRQGREKEEVLVCPTHGAVLGPGEFNYIRKESQEFLSKWKDKKDCQDVYAKFLSISPGDAKKSWRELMEYYYAERYLQDSHRVDFKTLIHRFLLDLKN